MLAANLDASAPLKVRLAALEAACVVVQVLTNTEEQTALQQLVPVMLNVRRTAFSFSLNIPFCFSVLRVH